MKDVHNKAAEHHESAAKSHGSPADSRGKNDHAKADEHSSQARLLHDKSSQREMP
jgi:hypothetical protein